MYINPQEYKCHKCALLFKWSEHYNNLTPFDIPFCPSCYCRFLTDNVTWGVKAIKNNLSESNK